MKKHVLTVALLALVFALAGCRGVESENEPIHPIWDMDQVARYDPQEPNDMFEDGRAMRQPAPGTVPRGFLNEDGPFHTGRTDGGNYVEKVPLPVTKALLRRGRARFNIYCTPCHGQAGDGQGIIMTGDYGYTPAPTYHKTALRDTADGYLFDVITNGVRNMPGYAQQVPVADRWAIVTYIRALQRSQNARRENVPPSVLARIEQTGSANMNAARNPTSSSGGSGSSGAPSSSTEGASASGADTTSASSPSSSEASAPSSADTAATSDTAATAAAPADSTGSGVGSIDTSSSAGAPVQADAAGRADAAGSAGEGGAAAASTEGRSSASDENSGRGFFGSTFFILVLVVLPIMVLVTILITAFRKDREH